MNRLLGGKIVETWLAIDQRRMLQHLGEVDHPRHAQ